MKTHPAATRFLFPCADPRGRCLRCRALLDQVTLRWFSRDLNSRGVLVATALSDSIGRRLG